MVDATHFAILAGTGLFRDQNLSTMLRQAKEKYKLPPRLAYHEPGASKSLLVSHRYACDPIIVSTNGFGRMLWAFIC